MAESDAPRSKEKTDSDDVLKDTRARWDRSYDREKHNITAAYEDLTFLCGDDYAQWPAEERKRRENDGRPVLQENRLPTFVHQVTGDIRQLKPAIKFVPVDNEADEKRAEIIGSLTRYIENRSEASAIYFRAADSQVACGIGHWRVLTEYADDTTFNQEIRIAPIEDGVAVLWDADSVLPSREDAMYCFVPVDMTRASFEAKYPGKTPNEIGDIGWNNANEWVSDDFVRVAEYWLKVPTKRKLALHPDGQISEITDADQSEIAMHLAHGARVETRDSHKVVRYLVTATDILEGPSDWAGRHIPIVPLIGEEYRIGRKLIRNGIVRNAKDPQRMLNYYYSAHTETVALQPKAPFMVTEVNVAKYQDLWEDANRRNLPYLVYEPDSKNGGSMPSRIQPPVSSQGVLEGLQLAGDGIKAVTGIYDASLGARGNETSGKAIMARQREGDVGTFLYIDNFARAIRRTGQIIVDLIPHVYDTERTIRIMGEDGRIDVIEINKAEGLGDSGQYVNDVTVGSYDVVAQMGPSYTTKREEAKDGMIAFVQAVPKAGELILDLLAKAQDWPMADDIAKRLRATLPPQMLKSEELEKQGATPEQIQQFMDQQQQNQPPPPEMMKLQAEMQIKQAQMQFEQEKAATDAQIEAAKMQEQARQADAKLQAEIMLEREKIASDERIAFAKMNMDAEARERDAHMRAASAAAQHLSDFRQQPENTAS